MKIHFEIEANEAPLLINALDLALQSVNNPAHKASIQKIKSEVVSDINADQVIRNNVISAISHWTKVRPILTTSNLRFGLSLTKGFMQNHLHQLCNKILISISPNHKSKVSREGANKCETIQDIINIIQTNI
ncbi:hypothetical protein [Fulvivirga sp.]|uniref:hypothetical protein n=1 Tax=Fulvivirga sp. TaxID=1931237 RepID=UPI0032EC96CF